MHEPNPYDPPRAEEAGVKPRSPQWGLVPTILFGAFAALMAMLPLAVVAGFVFSYYALPDDFETLTNAERHDAMLSAPYVKFVVVVIWVVGMVVGGFFGARRCAGKWLVASVGVASFYLVIWGIPSIVLAVGKLSVSQWISIAALVPAAMIGGAIARARVA